MPYQSDIVNKQLIEKEKLGVTEARYVVIRQLSVVSY